jgi:Brp/Blh family beta-carotene 15,15'-monooxygenase
MGICILGLGISHGALDHILYYELENRRKELPETKQYGEWIRPLFFYINYLIIMIIWSALWDTQPQVAFWAFLVVSSYHFGEGDLDYIQGISGKMKIALYVSRGSLVVGLTLTCEPDVTLPIIQKLIVMDEILFRSLCKIALPFFIIQHVCALLLLTKRAFQHNLNKVPTEPFPTEHKILDRNVCIYEFFRSTLFIALFLSTNPLIGFSVFFGVWHSATTIWGTIKFLKIQKHPAFEPNMSISWKDMLSFYVLAAPFTCISILGMLVVYKSRSVVGLDTFDPALLWAVFIGCISVLTGSHMWILTAMHWAEVTLDPCNLGILFGREQANRRIKSKLE